MGKQSKITAIDIGTMFFQVAEQDEVGNVMFKMTRNAFVEIKDSEDTEDQLKRNKWQYIKDPVAKDIFYVVGEDAMKVANTFPGVVLRRPLQDGVLNQNEEKNIFILTELIKRSVGKAPTPDSLICTCVSSPSVDQSVDSTFHRGRLQGIIKSQGWQVKVIEEGYAVALAEEPVSTSEDGEQLPLTGIAMSFGAGRVNCVMVLRGKQINELSMSVSYSGDKIDEQVAKATGKKLSHVTRTKEKKLDFSNLDTNDDVIYALDLYYSDMIKFVFSKFMQKFKSLKKEEFDFPFELVIAGGTASVPGFKEKIEATIQDIPLPFKISGVRISSDPRNSVVKGCLIQAAVSHRKLKEEKEKSDDVLGE